MRTRFANLEGLFLTGTALNASGNAAANLLRGNAGNNTLDGQGGIDTAVFGSRDGDYVIGGSVASRTVSGGNDGRDTLLSIERLQFSNVVIAFDSQPGGNTYAAYAMLNAAFNSAPSPVLLGQWTAQLDQLGNTRDLAQAMINFYAPGVSDDALVAHLWSTIIGTPLLPADQAYFVGLIRDGTFTQASLLELVSTHPLNTDEFVAIVGQPLVMDPAYFPLPG